MNRLLVRPSRSIGGQSFSNLASGLIVATLIILFLYMGREIFEPLIIAALLGFILAPLIRRLRNWGLWRVPSVILTVLLAIAVLSDKGTSIQLTVPDGALHDQTVQEVAGNVKSADQPVLPQSHRR